MVFVTLLLITSLRVLMHKMDGWLILLEVLSARRLLVLLELLVLEETVTQVRSLTGIL